MEKMRGWQQHKQRKDDGVNQEECKDGVRRKYEQSEPRKAINTEPASGSGFARLISRVLQSITAATEHHRGSQTQAKQTQQVPEKERKPSPWIQEN